MSSYSTTPIKSHVPSEYLAFIWNVESSIRWQKYFHCRTNTHRYRLYRPYLMGNFLSCECSSLIDGVLKISTFIENLLGVIHCLILKCKAIILQRSRMEIPCNIFILKPISTIFFCIYKVKVYYGTKFRKFIPIIRVHYDSLSYPKIRKLLPIYSL